MLAHPSRTFTTSTIHLPAFYISLLGLNPDIDLFVDAAIARDDHLFAFILVAEGETFGSRDRSLDPRPVDTVVVVEGFMMCDGAQRI